MRPVLALVWVAAWALGCDLQSDLSSVARVLGDPDSELIEGPGRRLAPGTFTLFRPEVSNAEGSVLVGVEVTDQGNQLAIVPFEDDQKACRAGALYGPGRPIADRTLSPPGGESGGAEALLPFIMTNADGDPELAFTTLACKRQKLRVKHGNLPFYTQFGRAGGMLVDTTDGDVIWIDPWNNERKTVLQGADRLPTGRYAFVAEGLDGPWIWSVEGGEIVARDAQFEERARVGSDIVNLAHSAQVGFSAPEGGHQLVYRTSDGTLGLIPVANLEESRVVAEDVCGEWFARGASSAVLYYMAPCSKRTLNVFSLDADEPMEIATGVYTYRITGVLPDGPQILYLTSASTDTGADGQIGTLWARNGSQKARKLGDNAHIGYTSFGESGALSVLRNWKKGRGGDLVEGKLGEELELRAKNVIYRHSWLGLLADFDGTHGTLRRKQGDQYKAVKGHVSPRGMRLDQRTERALLMTDIDPDTDTGTLSVLASDGLHPVSDSVTPDARDYSFTQQLDAVTLRRARQPDGTGSLNLSYQATGELVELADGVSEWLEIEWPQKGVLYSVPNGENAGLWFTEAR